MPDLQLLVPFAHTVQTGSYVATAARLQVTPSAISKSILKLERQLGIRLFNRTTRTLHLTEEGQEFYRRIHPLLQGMEEAMTSVAHRTSEPAGLVRVSATHTIAQYCLFPVIADFMRTHPAVQLDISVQEAMPNLVEREIDVCIHHERGRGTSQVSRVLCHYPIILVASPQYLRRHGVPHTPQDLAQHRCIGIRLPGGKATLELFRVDPASGHEPRKPVERFTHAPRPSLTIGEQVDSSLMAALYDAGIVPTPVPTALPYLHSGRLRCVLPQFRVGNPQGEALRIHLSYPHRQHMAAKVRVFIDFVVQHFQALDIEPADLAHYARLDTP